MRLFIGISLALHSVVLITGGGQFTGTPLTGTPVSVVLQPVTGTSSRTDSSEQDPASLARTSPAPSVPAQAGTPGFHDNNSTAPKHIPHQETDARSDVATNQSGSTRHEQRHNNTRPEAIPAATTGDLLTSELQAILAANFSYPSIARRNNWEGNVLASMRIEENGSLSHITLVKTSGYNVLDDATLQALQDIHVLPSAQDWLKGQHFDIVLPVKYRLINK